MLGFPMMSYKLSQLLRETEEITDLIGSFIISYPDGKVLATTLVGDIKVEIFNKIFDTSNAFQQFSNFLEIGTLNQFILEGANGIILIKKIVEKQSQRIVFFIGMGGKNLHLPLIKIALINFSKKVDKILKEESVS